MLVLATPCRLMTIIALFLTFLRLNGAGHMLRFTVGPRKLPESAQLTLLPNRDR